MFPEDEQCFATAGVRPWPSGYQASLAEGPSRGLTAARRPVEAVLAQEEVAAGATSPFLELVDRSLAPALVSRLEAGAHHARTLYAGLNDNLPSTYLSGAREDDAVGPDDHGRFSHRWLGCDMLQTDPADAARSTRSSS